MTKNQEIQENQKSRAPARVLTALWGIFTVLVVVLLFAERYLMDSWGELSADELVYHMKSTLDGTNPRMVVDALIRYGIPAVAVIALIFGIWIMLRKKNRNGRIFMAAVLIAEIAGLLFVKAELDRRINFTNYIKWTLLGTHSDFIADNYVDPGAVEITFPEKKRNLIYIFMESTEMTYADRESGGAFERNIIPELTALAQQSEDFSGEDPGLNGGISLPGSEWTMGAMFAMATGAPLKVALNGTNIRNEENFFPRMKSLGTILKDQGYRQELLIGSKAAFGSRGVFYEGHGGFDIRDYDYMNANGRIPRDYHVFWGYEDEKLFQFAREDLLEMSASGQPFNLTMLTVDTHFEDGYRCRLCRDEFGEQYADSFACASRQVAAFVEWVQQQDFYENTTIVICGDHPTMDKDFCLNVPETYQRRTYVAVINGQTPGGDAGTKTYRTYSTMDLFPTTLAAMNVRIEGDRLGLGTNLYSGKETLIEKYGLEECETQLKFPSPFLEVMSGDRITKEVMQEAARRVTITMEPLDENRVRLSLNRLGDYMSHKSVEKLELTVRDKASGSEEIFSLTPTLEDLESDKEYSYKKVYELDGRDPKDIEAEYYITVGKFKHYRIADLEHNLVTEGET